MPREQMARTGQWVHLGPTELKGCQARLESQAHRGSREPLGLQDWRVRKALPAYREFKESLVQLVKQVPLEQQVRP